MKKFIPFFAVTALAAMTACSNDEPLMNDSSSAEGMVSFTVTMPGEFGSRAVADGLSATQLDYVVFDEDGNFLFQKEAAAEFVGTTKQTTVQIPLVNGLSYNVAFFAKNPSAPYTITNGVLSIDYSSAKANEDVFDAFYEVKSINVTTSTPAQSVVLYRPFAQVNVGASDWYEASTAGFDVNQTTLKFTAEAYTKMNLYDGNATEPVAVEYDLNLIPDAIDYVKPNGTNSKKPSTLRVLDNDFSYMAMAYILPVKGASSIINTVKFDFEGPTGATTSVSVNTVPVQRNYRTNIVGSFFTSNIDYTIFIDNAFETPDNNIIMWDGKMTMEPPYDDATKTYSISYPAELAWLAQNVNGTYDPSRATAPANDFYGKKFVLVSDIDLGNYPWTPIGFGGKKFRGGFDGQGHKISNLYIPGNDSSVGLFGLTTDGTICNFTIENANVSGYLNVGAVAGTPYTATYSDIKLTGLIKINGFAYVGGAFGKNVYAPMTNITITADYGSYVKANSVAAEGAYRTYVGGIAGFLGEGNNMVEHSNLVSNIDVIGSTCDVGGIVGLAHYNNSFTNCSSSGNVKILAATDESDYREIGGIAGVWHNQNGTSVVFTNCTFTGVLSSVMEDGTDRTNEIKDACHIVGKPYSSTGTGTLIIDGVTMQSANVTSIATASEFVEFFNKIKGGTSFNGKTVHLLCDIDLEGVEIPVIGGNGPSGLILDGRGFAIKNYTIESSPCAGLFNSAVNLTVKNLVLENAKVTATKADDAYAGALVGKAYNITAENVTVKNSIITGTNKVGGMVGFISEDSSYKANFKNCSVENSTINNHDVASESGQTGGFAGYLMAVSTFENCSVTGTTINAIMNRSDRYCSQFVGTIHGNGGGDVTFTRVSVSGNTFNLSGSNSGAPLSDMIGGVRIAGVTVTIDGVATSY